jgi:hypothetical protein
MHSVSPHCPMDRSWLRLLKEEENILHIFPVYVLKHTLSVAYPGFFFGGGFQQIQLTTEGRENGGLGAVAP